MHICAWQSSDSRVTTDHCRVTLQWLFTRSFLIAWNVQKQSADGRVTSDHCHVTVQRLFSKKFPNCLKRPKNVVWQSADGCVTSDHCSRDRSATFFKKFSQIAWNVQKTLFDSRPVVAWPLTTVRVTVQWLFSKKFLIAWNVQKTLFDSRPTVAWPPTTVAWPFSDFFQNFPKSLETSKKRCLTVGRWSRDLWPLFRDRSATFFKKFPNGLKRRENVDWLSADGRLTSDNCCVTFQRLSSHIPP